MDSKAYWRRIQISILIAFALHGVLLYALATQFRTATPQEKILTVTVRMEKAPLVSPFSHPASSINPSQSVAAPPLKPKRPHKSILLLSKQAIPSSNNPETSIPLQTTAPPAVIAPASAVALSESALVPSGLPREMQVQSELSFHCSVRPKPVYPYLSRKLGEEGTVILRVELDENGQITSPRVSTSSGFRRLDEAALSAIDGWRCTAAREKGLSVRAAASQSFNFELNDH